MSGRRLTSRLRLPTAPTAAMNCLGRCYRLAALPPHPVQVIAVWVANSTGADPLHQGAVIAPVGGPVLVRIRRVVDGAAELRAFLGPLVDVAEVLASAAGVGSHTYYATKQRAAYSENTVRDLNP